MSGVREHYEWDEVQALLGDAAGPTADDVSITADGQRLDSSAAVIEFFDRLRSERAGVSGHG